MRVRFALLSVAVFASPAMAQAPLPGFAVRPLASHSPLLAVDMQAIIAPLWRGAPEGMEGKQTVSISIRRLSATTYRADITLGGLLDDAISDKQIRAHIAEDNSQWRLTALGERWRCARSGATGRWTTTPCS